MQALASILLLVERGDRVHQALSKALMLVRHFHARLDIFLCDTEGYVHIDPDAPATDARARTHARCVAEGSDYLQALRKSIVAPDVEIASEAICHRSLREAIAEKAQRSATDLIVKAVEASRQDEGGRGAADWAAVAACPVPLLLTRGRSWRPVPKFAAALESSHGAVPASARAVAELSATLALACGADVDLLRVRPGGADARDEPSQRGPQSPESFAGRAPAGPPRFLDGAAKDVVPAYVVERDYDLVVLEKPRLVGAPALRSVAGRVLAAFAGDVVLTDAVASGSGGASADVKGNDRASIAAADALAAGPRHDH